jgi:hypothetical protein
MIVVPETQNEHKRLGRGVKWLAFETQGFTIDGDGASFSGKLGLAKTL